MARPAAGNREKSCMQKDDKRHKEVPYGGKHLACRPDKGIRARKRP